MLIAYVLADKSDSSVDAYLKGVSDNQVMMLAYSYRQLFINTTFGEQKVNLEAMVTAAQETVVFN